MDSEGTTKEPMLQELFEGGYTDHMMTKNIELGFDFKV